MLDTTVPDPREAKLPGWARETLRALRSENRGLEADNARMAARLAGHVAAEEYSDTVLIDPPGGTGEIPGRPLGNGAHVRFSDFYEVHFGDVGSGARALFIDTDLPMAIRPQHGGGIIVTRA